MPASRFDAKPELKRVLHSNLFDRMCGIQLLTRKQFELSPPRLTRIELNGSRHVFVELKGQTITMTTGFVDVSTTDANGNIVRDTKQERIEKKRDLGKLIAKYMFDDQLLRAMQESYAASITDPNDELVHLFEIREALSSAFGGGDRAKVELAISNAKWSRLGQLCNNEPLRQGRHRGKVVGLVREATEAELSEARQTSLEMIEAYLTYREDGGSAK